MKRSGGEQADGAEKRTDASGCSGSIGTGEWAGTRGEGTVRTDPLAVVSAPPFCGLKGRGDVRERTDACARACVLKCVGPGVCGCASKAVYRLSNRVADQIV